MLSEDNANLTAPFILFEIDRAVSLYDGNKSTGPNGFISSSSRGFGPSLEMI